MIYDVFYIHGLVMFQEAIACAAFPGNAKYDLEGHDCGRDMLAYAQLCPNTALAREVNASC